MASFEYAIATRKPNEMDLTGPAFTDETEVPGVWDHATATTWAHVEGCKLPAGTVIVIWRWKTGPGHLPRQGHGAQHRAYVVGEDGIVRRTDR